MTILSGEKTGSKTAQVGLENSDQDTLAKAGHFILSREIEKPKHGG